MGISTWLTSSSLRMSGRKSIAPVLVTNPSASSSSQWDANYGPELFITDECENHGDWVSGELEKNVYGRGLPLTVQGGRRFDDSPCDIKPDWKPVQAKYALMSHSNTYYTY